MPLNYQAVLAPYQGKGNKPMARCAGVGGEALHDEQDHVYYLQPHKARSRRMICMKVEVLSF